LAEALSTVTAFEGFFLRMYVAVVSQMVLPTKSFTTYVTRVRPLICVCSLVDEQIITLGKLSVTIFADEPLLGPG